MESLAGFSFGELLKHFRRRQHLTQPQLAAKLGVHRNTIGIWERGDFLPDTKGMVLELAKHLHLSESETRQLLEASLTGLSPAWNVPYMRNPFFTGREKLLETLHERLSGEAVVVLTQSYALTGLGGIGKTQLAVEYAYRYGLSYAAVFWIGAENLETILNSFGSIAECLQLSQRQDADQEQIVATVQRWLNTHCQWLLIWDNVEDLALVQRFQPATRAGAILMTTRRQALGTLAQGIEIPSLTPEEGLLFLLRRARVLSPDAKQEQLEYIKKKRPTEYQAAKELVAAMDGLPLALDQAGAYLEETSCSVAAYLKLFETRRGQLLARRGEVAGEHPASVVATWSLSFEKVEQASVVAADLLRLCAFLQSDAIPEELLLQGVRFLDEQPGAEAADSFQLHEAMRIVSAYSLLRCQVEEQTYSMHRLVQAVLRESMDAHLVQQWMERTVHVIHAVLPEVEYSAWRQYERLVPHILVCASYPIHSAERHLELASLLFKAASYLYERAQYAQAESLFQQVLHMRSQALGEEHPDVARTLKGLADLYWRQEKFARAEELYKQALRILEQTLSGKHPDIARSLSGLAMLYWSKKRYEEAEELYKQALRISEQALGELHPDVARSLFGLGTVYADQGKSAEAETLLLRSLSICEQTLGKEHPDTVPLFHNLALLYLLQGKHEEAETLFLRSLSIWEKTLGLEHPNVAYGLVNLASLYMNQEKYEKAEALYEQALRISEQALGEEHPDVALKLFGLGTVYHNQGKYELAEPLYRRALAIREQALGVEHPKTQDLQKRYASLLQDMGQPNESELPHS